MELSERLQLLQTEGLNLRTATIYVVGELDSSFGMAMLVKCQMIREYFLEIGVSLKEINITLSSPGGDTLALYSMLDLYEILKGEGILVNVLVEGNCMSAATWIVAAASGKRMSTRRCRFMVHDLRTTPGEGSQAEQRAWANEVEREQQECYEMYAHWSLTKKKGKYTKSEFKEAIKEWAERCGKEYYFSAEEAKSFGFIDNIVN